MFANFRHVATIAAALFLFGNTAGAQDLLVHPSLHLEPTISASKINRRLAPPKYRSAGVDPVLRTEIPIVRLAVGEVVLVPLFSETEDGWPVPILWAIRNQTNGAAKVVMDDARLFASNGVTFSAYGDGGTANAGLSGAKMGRTAAVIGCETRLSFGSISVHDGIPHERDGSRHAKPSKYLCIQGQSPGKGMVFAGERDDHDLLADWEGPVCLFWCILLVERRS